MTSHDARNVPLDPTSLERLRAQGLEYRQTDMSDAADAEAFVQAEARGFLEARPSGEAIARLSPALGARRNIAVFDQTAARRVWPIATISSWVTPLTVPGGSVGMWAISAVSVAATHRRRGIARALLEGELRAAVSAGLPVAGLTVTEATIYGRYGFGAAVPVMRMRVDTRRAGWAAPAPVGRFQYLDQARLASELAAAHERARLSRAGQVPGWQLLWERQSGLSPDDKCGAGVRGVTYSDAEGVATGAMSYDLIEARDGFRFELRIRQLIAVDAEALAALWHFALHHDLVDTVTADLRPLDDPLPWLVADPRGIEQVVHDHHWLRVLDVPGFFGARTVRTPVDVVLRVTDPLGIADGTWRMHAGAGERMSCEASETGPDAELGIDVLSAISVGGVSASQLHAAGRIATDARTAAALDDALGTAVAPTLSIWY